MKLIVPDVWKSGDMEENNRDKEKDLDLLANAVLSVRSILFSLIYWFRKLTLYLESYFIFGSSLWNLSRLLQDLFLRF